MNDIIHCVLISASVLAWHEPPGLLHSDGKRPDGVSLVPWRSGKFLVRDATSVDTYAPSYRNLAVQAAAAIAARAESLKEEKYADLLNAHEFVPIAVESYSVLGP